jgi:hypothetical protein
MIRNLVTFAVTFVVGALLMVGIRGAGTATAHPEQAPAKAPAATPEIHDEHAGHGPTPAAPEAHAAHGQVAEATPHDHGKAQAAPAKEPAAKGPKSPADGEGSVDLWVCEQDPSYGLSWAGSCPLDGKPMVKSTVERSKLSDVRNAKCPIMGGATQDDVWAVYKGTVVHFCCPGCDGKFFAAPEQHIQKLREAK